MNGNGAAKVALIGPSTKYLTTATNPQQPVRLPTNQLPTPTGRTPPLPVGVPLGNEIQRKAREVATAAQQILTSVQRLAAVPAETRAGVDMLFAGLGREIQTARSNVASAAQLEKALPLLILAVGIVVRRPLIGALVATGFFLWQRRNVLPAPVTVPTS